MCQKLLKNKFKVVKVIQEKTVDFFSGHGVLKDVK